MSGEVQNRFHLFPGESIKHSGDFVNGEAIFKILKNSGNGNARSMEDPRAAYFSGYAFNRRAL